MPPARHDYCVFLCECVVSQWEAAVSARAYDVSSSFSLVNYGALCCFKLLFWENKTKNSVRGTRIMNHLPALLNLWVTRHHRLENNTSSRWILINFQNANQTTDIHGAPKTGKTVMIAPPIAVFVIDGIWVCLLNWSRRKWKAIFSYCVGIIRRKPVVGINSIENG